MKKICVCLIVAILAVCSVLTFTACGGKEKVIIYTSTEDYVMEYMKECLDKEFPEYDIKIEYMSTSNIAAKVIQEGSSSDCDIVYAEEYGYLEQMASAGVLANLKAYSYDYSIFTEDSLDTTAKEYLLPTIRTGGGIIVNNKVLGDRGLTKPSSYADLLSAEYKGMISMPSPKSSGTGYMFYLSLVNEMGEAKAIEYFDALTPNVLAYTTSGSGPVNALVGREVAVGFGMISQGAEKIASGNSELEILLFDEGAPFNLYGTSVVNGKEQKESVKKITDYFYNTFIDACCARYYPEAILKDKNYSVQAFPTNITYSNMNGNTLEKKQDLLSKWTH